MSYRQSVARNHPMGTCHGKPFRYGKNKNDLRRVWHKPSSRNLYQPSSEQVSSSSEFDPVPTRESRESPSGSSDGDSEARSCFSEDRYTPAAVPGDGTLDSDAQSCFSDESTISHRLARFDTASGSIFSDDASPANTQGDPDRGGRFGWGDFIDFEENLRLTIVSPLDARDG